jgi:hypothetical protein
LGVLSRDFIFGEYETFFNPSLSITRYQERGLSLCSIEEYGVIAAK